MGRRFLSDVPGIHPRNCFFPEIAADLGAKSFPLFLVEDDMEVKEVFLIPSKDIIGGGINGDFAKIEVKRKRTGVADVVLAVIDFVGGIVAFFNVAKVMPIDTTYTQLLAGDVVYMEKTNTGGTGLLIPDSIISVGFEYNNPPTS